MKRLVLESVDWINIVALTAEHESVMVQSVSIWDRRMHA